MKKPIERRSRDDMRPEYDFASMSGGIRGKHYQEYRKGSFLSRWWPSEYPENDGLLPGQLDGGIGDDSDVYEHEYPLIAAANKRGCDAIARFSDDRPLGTTLTEWDSQLRDSLTEAVRAEMRRDNLQDKSVQ